MMLCVCIIVSSPSFVDEVRYSNRCAVCVRMVWICRSFGETDATTSNHRGLFEVVAALLVERALSVLGQAWKKRRFCTVPYGVYW